MTFGTTESMIGGKADTTRSKWSVLAIAVVLGVASAMSPIMAPSASAVALLVGNSFTANGLNITVTGCTYEVGPSSLGCAAGNFEIVADPGGPGATVRIQGAGGSDLITASLGTVRHDIGVSLSITAINPGTTVNQVSMAMAGSASCTTCPAFPFSPVGKAITMGENVNPQGQPPISLSPPIDLTDPSRLSSVFTPVASLSVHKDIVVWADRAGVGTLVLSHVSQSYLPAPEPASIALLSVGAIGLFAARRRRNRPSI